MCKHDETQTKSLREKHYDAAPLDITTELWPQEMQLETETATVNNTFERKEKHRVKGNTAPLTNKPLLPCSLSRAMETLLAIQPLF